MGTHWVLANHDEQEYVEFDNNKGRSIGGDGASLTNQMIAEYVKLVTSQVGASQNIELVRRDERFYDEMHEEYDNATCDVLYSMFESGYVPTSNWETGWIFTQFKDADRMHHMKKWMDKW